MKLIGYMAVHNGADFIEYAIRSTIKHCDRFIVIEGAWFENIMANQQPRSTDGTLDILSNLQKEFPQLEVYQENLPSQLKQRSAVFEYLKDEKQNFWIWLIDHDEVYDDYNIASMISKIRTSTSKCLKVNSYTFINDFKHYVTIAWPRLFVIEPGNNYEFYAPNHILRNGTGLRPDTIEDSVVYYHYSYCHTPERFLEKRRERILLHGQFKWDLDDNGLVIAPGTSIKEFTLPHPAIMKTHPLYPK